MCKEEKRRNREKGNAVRKWAGQEVKRDNEERKKREGKKEGTGDKGREVGMRK